MTILAVLNQHGMVIEAHGQDKYMRTLGDVFLSDGTHINRELVAQGWCWWYQKYALENVTLAALEAGAGYYLRKV